jgi:hypothetical protein
VAVESQGKQIEYGGSGAEFRRGMLLLIKTWTSDLFVETTFFP